MKLELLISCMHQTDDALIHRSGITGDVLMVNQCDHDEQQTCRTKAGTGRIICTRTRGLTVSRNIAIEAAKGDVCLLCDDDEVFTADYEQRILKAYEQLPQADVIIFKMIGRTPSFPDQVMRLRFPKIMKVSSWQISFRTDAILRCGIRFDELLGAGTGNGAEEELKFLLDCQKAGLKIYYVPTEIATVGQTASTWFEGFDRKFFINRGATTRYILGWPLALVYGIFYVIKKRPLYRQNLSPLQAMGAIWKGMRENKITKQRRALNLRRNSTQS